jgi:hypothetical protein
MRMWSFGLPESYRNHLVTLNGNVSGSTGFCGHVFSGASELKNDLESGSGKSFEDISVIPESENS